MIQIKNTATKHVVAPRAPYMPNSSVDGTHMEHASGKNDVQYIIIMALSKTSLGGISTDGCSRLGSIYFSVTIFILFTFVI